MKNPKVGERVALHGVITEVTRVGYIMVALVEGDELVEYLIPAHDARRLLPKKRERTYTEAEIEAAFARAFSIRDARGWSTGEIIYYFREARSKATEGHEP